MDLSSIDPFKVEASPFLDNIIHQHLFAGAENEADCPSYSSRRQNGLQVADALEALFGISIRLGRLRVKEHKMYFARAGREKESATEILAVSLSLAICRLAILLMQRKDEQQQLRQDRNQPPPSLPYRGWED